MQFPAVTVGSTFSCSSTRPKENERQQKEERGKRKDTTKVHSLGGSVSSSYPPPPPDHPAPPPPQSNKLAYLGSRRKDSTAETTFPSLKSALTVGAWG